MPMTALTLGIGDILRDVQSETSQLGWSEIPQVQNDPTFLSDGYNSWPVVMCLSWSGLCYAH